MPQTTSSMSRNRKLTKRGKIKRNFGNLKKGKGRGIKGSRKGDYDPRMIKFQDKMNDFQIGAIAPLCAFEEIIF